MDVIKINRSELKYLLSWHEAVSLQNELSSLLVKDPHSKFGTYPVRSLYFDSFSNQDYYEKLAGIEKRKKVRIRIYHPDDIQGKFEIKQKDGNYSHKRSLSISKDEIIKSINCDYSFLLNHNSQEAFKLYSILTLNYYTPKAIIEYQRNAFIYPENNIRITFDSSIKSAEFQHDLFSKSLDWRSIDDSTVILEVKFNGQLYQPISAILQKYHLDQISVSKYTVGRPLYTNCFY